MGSGSSISRESFELRSREFDFSGQQFNCPEQLLAWLSDHRLYSESSEDFTSQYIRHIVMSSPDINEAINLVRRVLEESYLSQEVDRVSTQSTRSDDSSRSLLAETIDTQTESIRNRSRRSNRARSQEAKATSSLEEIFDRGPSVDSIMNNFIRDLGILDVPTSNANEGRGDHKREMSEGEQEEFEREGHSRYEMLDMLDRQLEISRSYAGLPRPTSSNSPTAISSRRLSDPLLRTASRLSMSSRSAAVDFPTASGRSRNGSARRLLRGDLDNSNTLSSSPRSSRRRNDERLSKESDESPRFRGPILAVDLLSTTYGEDASSMSTMRLEGGDLRNTPTPIASTSTTAATGWNSDDSPPDVSSRRTAAERVSEAILRSYDRSGNGSRGAGSGIIRREAKDDADRVPVAESRQSSRERHLESLDECFDLGEQKEDESRNNDFSDYAVDDDQIDDFMVGFTEILRLLIDAILRAI